nr:hypothetical protein [Psychrobacter sp. JCM 18900]
MSAHDIYHRSKYRTEPQIKHIDIIENKQMLAMTRVKKIKGQFF